MILLKHNSTLENIQILAIVSLVWVDQRTPHTLHEKVSTSLRWAHRSQCDPCLRKRLQKTGRWRTLISQLGCILLPIAQLPPKSPSWYDRGWQGYQHARDLFQKRLARSWHRGTNLNIPEPSRPTALFITRWSIESRATRATFLDIPSLRLNSDEGFYRISIYTVGQAGSSLAVKTLVSFPSRAAKTNPCQSPHLPKIREQPSLYN